MSEFRRDLVSGDWIILAPERAKRPHDMLARDIRRPTPKETCPFEDLQKSGNWPPIGALPDEKNWRVVVIPNKFPALDHHHVCAEIFHKGPFEVAQGVGHHELVITRDHDSHISKLAPEEAVEVMSIIQGRYFSLAKDGCMQYAVAFFNWGPTAGASLYHPHYQIWGLPIVPPSVTHSLHGSARYLREHGGCAHCAMIEFERAERTRIVAENEHAVAFAPFASRNPFSVHIFPKEHRPYFERTPAAEVKGVTLLLQDVLRRIREYLQDPDLNFFIHTAPLKNQDAYGHYHWHIEIMPKISVPAGFELSTGILVNVIDPDRAASVLRTGQFS
jgi:UDPglucose--hexose-1-phosphate uridylyltransferase